MSVAQPAERSVQDILNFQREESEARDIIKDLDNLQSTPKEKQNRWIWELIQNAKDCARVVQNEIKEVSILVTLKQGELIFQHDGVPFTPEDLIALLRRTSNKNYQNTEGNTGKYGTGFVSTHLLSYVVHLDAFLSGKGGEKNFKLTIDRSFDDKETLQHELVRVFAEVERIRSSGGYTQHHQNSIYTRFIYPLDDRRQELVSQTLEELTNNIYFTLRCNPSIRSLIIKNEITGKDDLFQELPRETVSPNISFFPWHARVANEPEEGLLYFTSPPLELGLPVKRQANQFSLASTANRARFFKDLPLIGTEHSNLPFLVQGNTFRPPEPRDGLRTIRNSDHGPDQIADTNRSALAYLPNVIISFYKELLDLPVSGLHLLAETGIPQDPYNYLDRNWYRETIQAPLRTFFREQPIVETASGERKTIEQCFFIDYPEVDTQAKFYDLVSAIMPESFPNSTCYKAWDRIIQQEKESWPPAILFSFTSLLEKIHGFSEDLDGFPIKDENAIIQWFNALFSLLNETHQTGLADGMAIYPNQAGTLGERIHLKTDTIHNEDFKNVLWHFGHPIRAKLLHPEITNTSGFEAFDREGIVRTLHTTMGTMSPAALEPELITDLLQLVSMFRRKNAPARNELHRLLRQLMPEKVPPISEVNDLDFYDWNTPDQLALRYISWKIEQSVSLDTFAKEYFQKEVPSAVAWLNDLYSYMRKEEDRWAQAQKFKIFPVQSGNFEKLTPNLRSEDSFLPFPEAFKKLNQQYIRYIKQPDPYSWLVDRRITKELFTPISLIDFVKPLNDLFSPIDAELEVREGHPYNELFHDINNYCNEHEDEAKALFPTFVSKQADFLLKAMGESVSRKVMIVNKMGRSEEDLHKLKELKLPAQTLAELEDAATKVGGPAKLIDKANSMAYEMEQAEWRKKVGSRAEAAFLETIKGIKIDLLEIENPDEGRDFTLKMQGRDKEYSIEIKSTGIGLDAISMSRPQGKMAAENPQAYALCVVPRDDQNEVSLEHFLAHARFKTDIGFLLSPKMQAMEAGLTDIAQQEDGEDVSISLDNKKYSIFVKRKIWSRGETFDQFLVTIKTFFDLT